MLLNNPFLIGCLYEKPKKVFNETWFRNHPFCFSERMIAETKDFDNGEIKKGQRMLALTLDILCRNIMSNHSCGYIVYLRKVRNKSTKTNLPIGGHYVN